MKLVNLSDKELVNIYIKGDERALQELVNRHKSRIYSYILATIKNKALAEKHEAYEKKYGLPSYILIIFIIIIVNASSAPEHSNSMFSWAAMRN